MLSDFAEKKRNFLNLTKQNFSQSKKSHFFPKGLTYAFVQKMPIFSLFNLIKISLEIMLSDFAQKKETFFTLKNIFFLKSRKSPFLQSVNSCF